MNSLSNKITRNMLVIMAVLTTSPYAISAPEARDIISQPVPSKIMPFAEKARFIAFAKSSKSLIAVGERGIILLSDDGVKWIQQQSPVDVTLTSVIFETESRVWAVGHGATILRSDDGGRQWKIVNYDPKSAEYYLKIAAHGERIYVIGTDGQWLTSNDIGQSWVKSELLEVVTDPTSLSNLFSIAFGKNNAEVISAERGGIFFRPNADAQWTSIKSPYNGSFFGVQAIGDNFILYGMSGHAFLFNTESQTWKEIQTQSKEFILDSTSIPIDGREDTILVGRGGLVIRVDTEGNIINEHFRPDQAAITAIMYKDEYIYIATMRGGVVREEVSTFLKK